MSSAVPHCARSCSTRSASLMFRKHPSDLRNSREKFSMASPSVGVYTMLNISSKWSCKSCRWLVLVPAWRVWALAVSTYFIVEDQVLLLHGCQECVLGQVVLPRRVLLVSPLGLLLQGLDAGREQAGQVKVPPLLLRVRRAMVEVGRVEQHRAAHGAVDRSLGAQREVRPLGLGLIGHIGGAVGSDARR